MASLNETVDLLGRCLGTVLREQEGDTFFQLEERIRLETKRLREARADTGPMQRELAAVSLDDAEKLVRAFSTYFLLINLAEEHARVHRVLEPGTSQRREGFEQALAALKAEGFDADRARKLICGLDLGLTFTAHPTEMRRRTVRAHLEQISQLLENAEPAEPITAHVEALWSTPWLKDRHPTVRDEVNGGLAYLDVISAVLPRLERDLEARFEKVFGEKAVLHLPLSLHSWMGGDRDGNPNVTPKATEETFVLHFERASSELRARLDDAYARLSQNAGTEVEPFRAELREVQQALSHQHVDELQRGIEDLLPQLRGKKQSRTADVLARPLAVQARIFGLHLASLDVREHSSLTGAAVEELLTRAGVKGYASLDEAKKVEVLRRELATRRPLLAVGETAPDAVEKVVGPLRAVRAARARAGERAFGRYVVSMSEQPSDLLEVLLLAREAGVDAQPVPLFETLDDLERAPQVMRAVLELPEYRAHLGERLQEVMIGYSDSNKDGGFVAANWALHEAQRRLAKVFDDAKVRYRFFHGRGTSIGRGGGPMARALFGQPAGTVGNGMRITEQGEAL
ncbi:MAG: phosphoenolpyruvate carboxylase [Myxococcaceae bacterium]|nr:phosphoenolpyruvate carboxylase [Myxococcaceae bacterium]